MSKQPALFAFFMPLYQYQSCSPEDPAKSCLVCRAVFELRRSLQRAETLLCPTCQNPVRKVPSRAFTPQESSFSLKKAQRVGFTTLHNEGDGVFKKE